MITLNLKEIFERFDVYENTYTLDPESLSLPEELGSIREPVSIHIRITKDKEGYDVHLNISGNIELECSRCLSLFLKDLTQDRNKHIESYPDAEHIPLSEEDLEVSFMDEPDIIKLEELVREEIILSVPMKPLCRPDCPGEHHGALVLGEEKEAPRDPRFAILKDLLTR